MGLRTRNGIIAPSLSHTEGRRYTTKTQAQQFKTQNSILGKLPQLRLHTGLRKDADAKHSFWKSAGYFQSHHEEYQEGCSMRSGSSHELQSVMLHKIMHLRITHNLDHVNSNHIN